MNRIVTIVLSSDNSRIAVTQGILAKTTKDKGHKGLMSVIIALLPHAKARFARCQDLLGARLKMHHSVIQTPPPPVESVRYEHRAITSSVLPPLLGQFFKTQSKAVPK